MVEAVGEWLEATFGTAPIARDTEVIKKRTAAIQASALETQQALALLTDRIIRMEGSIMAKFSEYQTAVNETLSTVAELIVSESAEIQAAIEAAKSPEEVTAALGTLTENRVKIYDAIKGLISTTPSPTEPTPAPTPGEPLPPIDVPVDGGVTGGGEDPEVPVEIVPSPPEVGVDGGSNIDVVSE